MGTSASSGARRSSVTIGLVTDFAVVAYGAWTIVAHAVVIAGGTISTLTVASAALCAALLVAATLGARQGQLVGYIADLRDDPCPEPRAFDLRAALALLFGAVGLVLWLATASSWTAWAGIALSSVALTMLALRARPFAASTAAEPAGARSSTAPRDRLERLVLHAAALACALFTLLSYRPRSDDTQYLHLAVSAVDYPDQALLAAHTLHGPASASLPPQTLFPPYRVHSFELLGALLSHVTGIDVASTIHFGLATLFAWLTPFALARLLRLLVPRYWLPALLFALSFLFIEGSASRGYANHALVRMFNGKSVLLTSMVPLIFAYGMRFAARPSPGRFAMLALSQVAGVGLSSTGLWLVPTASIVAVTAGSESLRAFVRRLPLALMSSAYVLALGLWVMDQMTIASAEPADIDAALETSRAGAAQAAAEPRFALLTEAVRIALGPERTAIALLALALVSIAAAPTALAMRLFAALALVAALGFANPWIAAVVARRVTGLLTYYRFFWLLPVPVMLGASLVACRSWLGERLRPRLAWTAAVAALLGFYAIAVDRLVISEANQAKLTFPPRLKAWAHARLVAEEVCRLAPAGQHVLASKAVLLQLPTIHECGHPLLADERWLIADAADERRRALLVRYAGDPGDLPANKAQWFIDSLRHYHIDAIVVSNAAQPNARVKSLVRVADYEKVATVDWEHIYVPTRPETQASYDRVVGAICEAVRGDASSAVLAPFGVSDRLDRRGCARAIAAPDGLLRLPAQELADVLRLERLTYMESDSKKGEHAWVMAELNRRGIQVVALNAPALANRRFKALLRQLGFHSVKTVEEHSILRRPPPRR